MYTIQWNGFIVHFDHTLELCAAIFYLVLREVQGTKIAEHIIRECMYV